MKRRPRKKKDFLVPEIDFRIDMGERRTDELGSLISERVELIYFILEKLEENGLEGNSVYQQYENELHLLIVLGNVHEENLKHEE